MINKKPHLERWGCPFLGLIPATKQEEAKGQDAQEIPGVRLGQGKGDRNHHADTPETGHEVTGANPVTQTITKGASAHVENDVHAQGLLAEDDVVGTVAGQTADNASSHGPTNRTTDGSTTTSGRSTAGAVDHHSDAEAEEVLPGLLLVGDVGVAVDRLLITAVLAPEFGRRQADVQELTQGGFVVGRAVELAVLLVDQASIADFGLDRETIPPLLLSRAQ